MKITENNNQDVLSFHIEALFANEEADFISGFLSYQSTIDKSLDYTYHMYNCTTTYEDNKNIIKLPTLTLGNLRFISPSVCRYINNYIKCKTIYLNFSILKSTNDEKQTSNNLIKNILPSLLNLNEAHGMLISCFAWNKENNDESIFFIYILCCMYNNIKLVWMPWEENIWVICSDKKITFDKIKYIDIMESNGYDIENTKNNHAEFRYVNDSCDKFFKILNIFLLKKNQ